MGKGVSKEAAKTIAIDFVNSLNYQVPLDFKIRDSWKELYGVDGIGGGGFHSAVSNNERGIVTVAANNHRSNAAVLRTLQHEILGHYLVNTYTPQEKRAAIAGIMASQNEPSLKEHWQKVNAQYSEMPLSIQAEEVFASIAERVDINPLNHPTKDLLLTETSSINLNSVESSIQHRVNLLKAGELEQKTFPNTDIHSGPFAGFDLELRATEWKRNHPAPEVQTQSPPQSPRG